jgi:uncharacterized NAD-dependent epimerase/dehydratase family protein
MTDQKNTNSSTSKQMTVDFATESPVATNMGDTGTKNECTGTAIVYCEGNFAEIDGKTANGLVRSSEKYQIMSVIDSKKEGMDAGVVLDGEEIGIPIYKSLDDALNHSAMTPDYFIYGVAPASGILSLAERMLILKAMAMGMNIVNGLHEFLNEDSEFSAAAIEHQVKILDVRKPRAKKIYDYSRVVSPK